MEELIILNADGQNVNPKKILFDRDCIHLGKANGGYMNCTRESVDTLQAQKSELLKKRSARTLRRMHEYRKRYNSHQVSRV